jgi:CRP/FNR family transcriptional regulator, cyclic AMP receptor protein
MAYGAPYGGQPMAPQQRVASRPTLQMVPSHGQASPHATPAGGMQAQTGPQMPTFAARQPPKIQPVSGDPTPFLKRVPLLSGLPDDKIRALLEIMTQQTLEPQEPLYEKGEEGDCLFIVTLGRLEEYHDAVRVVTVPPWTSLGERVLLGDFLRDATAIAGSSCRVLRVDGPKLVDALVSDKELAAVVYENLARRLAARFDEVIAAAL